MPSYYPIFLDIKSKLCVVVGGGDVAERKVRSLVEQGAQVKVISRTITEGLESLVQQGAVLRFLPPHRPPPRDR